MTITACELRAAPPIIPGMESGQMTVHATLEDGSETDVFSYYTDELTFTAEEFVGLTVSEASKLFHDRDIAWLRS